MIHFPVGLTLLAVVLGTAACTHRERHQARDEFRESMREVREELRRARDEVRDELRHAGGAGQRGAEESCQCQG